jgi:hypothetical protein
MENDGDLRTGANFNLAALKVEGVLGMPLRLRKA